MEFPFENLEVYQKALHLYRLASAPGERECDSSADCLKHAILDLARGVVTGANCWDRDTKVKHFQNALESARCLTPLLEAAVIEGRVHLSLRERFREEIDGICRMLASLARRTKEWPEKGERPPLRRDDSSTPAAPAGTAAAGSTGEPRVRKQQRPVTLDTPGQKCHKES